MLAIAIYFMLWQKNIITYDKAYNCKISKYINQLYWSITCEALDFSHELMSHEITSQTMCQSK